MFQVQHLRKDYAATTILSDISFLVNDTEHVGLIGPNGTGKSTLLRLLTGQEQPDAGVISFSPPGQTLGYLPQSFASLDGQTVGDVLTQALAELRAAEAALDAAAEALGDTQAMDIALATYEAAVAAFEALGGYEAEQRVAEVMSGLGLDTVDHDRLVASLSGGQKTRLGLATLLLRAPDVLLLDEPTNHLDVAALEWLEVFVRAYPRACLIVSHDRAFLDRTVTRILYIDPTTRTLKSYTGNYSDFAATRVHERELHVEAWGKQQEYVSKVQSDISRLKAQSLNVELASTPKDSDAKFFLSGKGGSKKVARKARARQHKLERYLDSDERVEKPRQNWGLKLDFGEPPVGGRAVLRVDALSFGYGNNADVFSNISFDVDYGERVALVGPNGAGKTTLLKLIAGSFAPRNGTIRLGTGVRLGVMAQEQETLDANRTVLETVRHNRPINETEARNFLHFFLFAGDSVFRPVGICSLGERSRLQLALLVLQGCNLLLLDEPLNHLDIEGREHFEQALDAFEGTVIAVAHDRAFLGSYAERVIEVDDGAARDFVGGYDEYLARR